MHELDDELRAREYTRKTYGTYIAGEMTAGDRVPPPEAPHDIVEKELIRQHQETQARRHIAKHSELWEGTDRWISNMTDDFRENLPRRIRGLVTDEQKDPSLHFVTIGGEPPLEKIFYNLLQAQEQVKNLVQFVSKLRQQPQQQQAELVDKI